LQGKAATITDEYQNAKQTSPDKAKGTTTKIEQPATMATAKDANAQQQTDPEFSAEFDAKLKAMKADNKTWKEISEELGRSASTLKTRFKQIKDVNDDDAAADKGNKGNSKAESKTDGDKKANAHDTSKGTKAQDKNKDTKAQDKNKDTKAQAKASKPTSNVAQVGEPVVLEEDDTFSYDDLRALVRIYQNDHAAFWQRIANRFADHSGRDLHAQVFKDKFGQVWPHS
jgi:hypothetical protein